ncbi:MAG TPA: IPT/TIG domain-containing protein [Planctomycetota bacterium]|jgi:hypothetical protein|nr:IPT/TIG domain-containing protein [Planctomycetota bacterium]
MRTASILSIGLAAAIGAGTSRAQVASTSSYSLSSLELVAFAAGGSSPGAGASARAGYGALGSVAVGEAASPTRQGFSNFLHAFDPFGGTGPILFDVSPAQGPTGGGTAVELRGARFQAAGTAGFGSVGVPSPATSPTRAVATSPASGSPIPAGPVLLVRTDGGGAAALPGGFRYVPAVLASSGVVPGNDVLVRWFGPAGNAFAYALSIGSFPPFPLANIGGFLQLDPLGVVFVSTSAYMSDGSQSFQYPTPPSPALSGATVFWQSVVLPPTSPEFSNLGSTSFQ